MRGLLPLGDTRILPLGERDNDTPFATGMSPTEAEWAFDSAGLAYRSYLRVAVVQNPFIRMARLYEKIAQHDPLWQARERTGFGRRDFGAWLASTRPDGLGAGTKHGPRWRRFGAWSAKHWCGDMVSHVIRQEAIEDDLTTVLSILGVAPGFDHDFTRAATPLDWRSYYDDRATAIIQDRYGWDLAQYGYATPSRRKAG